jgi:hypothetical protein
MVFPAATARAATLLPFVFDLFSRFGFQGWPRTAG